MQAVIRSQDSWEKIHVFYFRVKNRIVALKKLIHSKRIRRKKKNQGGRSITAVNIMVIDAHSNRPLAGVSIDLYSYFPSVFGDKIIDVISKVTAGEGTVSFSPLIPGIYTWKAALGGFETYQSKKELIGIIPIERKILLHRVGTTKSQPIEAFKPTNFPFIGR